MRTFDNMARLSVWTLGASGCVREVHGEQRIVWRKCATTCVNPQCSAGQCRWSDASVGRCLGLGLKYRHLCWPRNRFVTCMDLKKIRGARKFTQASHRALVRFVRPLYCTQLTCPHQLTVSERRSGRYGIDKPLLSTGIRFCYPASPVYFYRSFCWQHNSGDHRRSF